MESDSIETRQRAAINLSYPFVLFCLVLTAYKTQYNSCLLPTEQLAWQEHYVIGPLHAPVTWYKITHAGTQVAQWISKLKLLVLIYLDMPSILKIPLRVQLASWAACVTLYMWSDRTKGLFMNSSGAKNEKKKTNWKVFLRSWNFQNRSSFHLLMFTELYRFFIMHFPH